MTARYRVVITDWPREVSDIERDILGKVGAEVIAGQFRDTKDAIDKAKDADALLTSDLPITREVFDKLTRLKVVVKYGIGIDNVDVKAATERGVQVVTIPDVMTVEVAEHTLGLLLAIVRKIPMADRLVKEGKWADPSTWAGPVPRICGKTVGIIGLGRIGRVVANLLKSFKVTIIGYDPHIKREAIERLGIEAARNLEGLLKESDFVTIHVPLTDETRHMIGISQLKSMKKNAFLINCARGAIIDPQALCRALSDGCIAGAATDVFEKEPVDPNDPLLKLKNLIATPHMAFYSDEATNILRRRGSEEVARVLKGQRPLSLVNPEALERNKWK